MDVCEGCRRQSEDVQGGHHNRECCAADRVVDPGKTEMLGRSECADDEDFLADDHGLFEYGDTPVGAGEPRSHLEAGPCVQPAAFRLAPCPQPMAVFVRWPSG